MPALTCCLQAPALILPVETLPYVKMALSEGLAYMAHASNATLATTMSGLLQRTRFVVHVSGNPNLQLQMLRSATGYVPASKPSRSSSDSGMGRAGLKAAIAAPVTATAVLLAVGLYLAWHHQRHTKHKDLLGHVLGPKLGPATTLVISDVASSTTMWEVLPPEVANKTMQQVRHWLAVILTAGAKADVLLQRQRVAWMMLGQVQFR